MKGSMSRLPVWIAAAAIAVLLALMLTQTEGGSTASQQERRIAEVLSAMAGAGRVEVALYYAPQSTPAFASSAETTPTGAVIVAEGAGQPSVKLALTNAVMSLTGLGADKITVIKMK